MLQNTYYLENSVNIERYFKTAFIIILFHYTHYPIDVYSLIVSFIIFYTEGD